MKDKIELLSPEQEKAITDVIIAIALSSEASTPRKFIKAVNKQLCFLAAQKDVFKSVKKAAEPRFGGCVAAGVKKTVKK